MSKRLSATGVVGVYAYGERFIARISGVVARKVERPLPRDESRRRRAERRRRERLELEPVFDGGVYKYYRKTLLGIFDTIDEARAAYETARREKEERKDQERERRREELEEARQERIESKSCHYVGVTSRINVKGRVYFASISINGRCKYLGIYKTAEEAHAAFIAAKGARDSDATRYE